MTGTQGLISIVILAHNKAHLTRLCLRSLLRTTHRPLEFLIVDNGSSDDTPALLQSFATDAAAAHVDLRIITNHTNVGCSTGRNQGIAASHGEFVLFMDNDVLVRTANWGERMVAELRRDPSLGLIGPKLVYPFPPYLIQFAGGEVSPSGRVNFAGRGQPRDEPQFNSPRLVQCFISACMLLPRRVVERVGGFDEAFNPIQFEDIDYCYRVKELSLHLLYFPSVEFYHFENITSGGTPALNYRYLTVKNGMRFKQKWQHRFAVEGGPPEHSMMWKDIPPHRLEDLPDLEPLP